MEGYLKKWVNVFQRWQNRYFILNDDVLIYCDHQGAAIKGQIHLKVAAIMLVPDDPLRIIINTGTTEVQLRAANVTEKIEWVNALKSSQEKCLEKSTDQKFEQRIQELLTDVWITSAAFDETLNLLIPRLEKTSHIKEMAGRLEGLGKNLKIKITLCAQMIEDEKQKYSNIDDGGTVYQSFINMSGQRMMSVSEIPSPYQDQSLIVPGHGCTIQEVMERLKASQPIKYRNLVQNPVFQKLRFTDSKFRDRLPHKVDPNEKLNVWLLCKELIGKDLGRFSVPIILNEPLSMLQRLAETMEYADTLIEANQLDDSCLRMCYVMGFGISLYAGNIGRTKKPFNPILGETYEIQNDKFRFVSEQVSHHPPVSAGYGESDHFEFWGHTDVHTKFTGLQFVVHPVGTFNVVLKKHKDHFQYNRGVTKVQNILWGQIFIDNVGVMKFQNTVTGDEGQLELLEKSSKSHCQVVGWVRDKNKVERYKIKGHWNDQLIAYNDSKEIVVWKRNPLPAESNFYYNFTEFALQLNHLTVDQLRTLPSTDCRLRPDQMAMENGWIELASAEKHRLEEKQRARRKQMEVSGQKHKTAYFDPQQTPTETWYKYRGNYFDRNRGQDHLDLF